MKIVCAKCNKIFRKQSNMWHWGETFRMREERFHVVCLAASRGWMTDFMRFVKLQAASFLGEDGLFVVGLKPDVYRSV